jgi:aromatic ring-opening dioxygenase catalytic subunit (LigB family)
MPLVYCGACSHAPGITARAEKADTQTRQALHKALYTMGDDIRSTKPDALVVVAAEHFANFFMNNMPAYALGMCDSYDGPIEDPAWLRIPHRHVRGNAGLSRRLIGEVQKTVDVAYAEEWRFDHGIMVPLHFLDPENELTIIPANINCQGPPLTPLARAWTFGEALRRAADTVPERIALVCTGGISHWPATPDSGMINETWDRSFLDRWVQQDKAGMVSYSDEEIYRDAGQGGFEIRTFIAAAAAARGRGTVHFYAPIPIFAVGCTIATMEIT